MSSRQWSSTRLFSKAHRQELGISHPEKKSGFKHSLNFIATTRDEHNMCAAIVFLLKNASAIQRTMLQFRENAGTPENDYIFFLNLLKNN